ncbi:hypothetical protein [Pseudorhodoferax sp.]|uniref:hypothetical protein n=1 Tax=Pseudorhodoferax sp. TaxID=1993553 RepID=UPI002DD66D83|nr:hypothetical protein [Pseudorhodoferax sp.]
MTAARSIDDEFLRPAEVKELTDGATDLDEQERILKRDGIPHRRRDKRILVSRFHVREWLAGKVFTPSRGIRWDLVK